MEELYSKIINGAHTLIGGSTGCGKSVLLDTIICYILKDKPDASLILIDPKRVSLVKYKSLRQVGASYACEYLDAKLWLEVSISLMEDRYKQMQERGEVLYTGCDLYIIIDELADLMTMPDAKKEIKPLIQHIAQLGRAAKVHLICATQCPSRKIIPAEITLNFTEKIALRCDTEIESKQLIGRKGAECINDYGKAILRTKGRLYELPVPKIADDVIQALIRTYTVEV